MRDSGKSSFGDALLRSVKSAHMRHLPVALRTRTGLARHSGCFTSCMPLLLAASLSPPLLPPVCWHATELLHLGGGGASLLMARRRSMVSRATPRMSLGPHAMMSLLLWRTPRMFARASGQMSAPSAAIFWGDPSSRGTLRSCPSGLAFGTHLDGERYSWALEFDSTAWTWRFGVVALNFICLVRSWSLQTVMMPPGAGIFMHK